MTWFFWEDYLIVAANKCHNSKCVPGTPKYLLSKWIINCRAPSADEHSYLNHYVIKLVVMRMLIALFAILISSQNASVLNPLLWSLLRFIFNCVFCFLSFQSKETSQVWQQTTIRWTVEKMASSRQPSKSPSNVPSPSDASCCQQGGMIVNIFR